MPKYYLLASAATVEDLEKLIDKCFYTTGYKIGENLEIIPPKPRPGMDIYRVRRFRGRYRFEFRMMEVGNKS